MSNQTFPEWLKKKMYERGLYKSQLAAYLEVHHATVGYWLNGTYKPKPGQAVKLAKYFKTDPDFVLEMVGHRPPKTDDLHVDFRVYISRRFADKPRLRDLLVQVYEAFEEPATPRAGTIG